MALPVFVSIEVAFRLRPVYAKLNSQLDRYQQVVEPLRRLAIYGIPAVLGIFGGASSRRPAGRPCSSTCTRRRSASRTRSSTSTSRSTCSTCRSGAACVAFASAVIIISFLAALATSYLYGAIRLNGRELRISRTARIQLATTVGIYIAVQAVSVWLDQYATRHESERGLPGDGRRLHRGQRDHPGEARSSRSSPRSSPSCSSSRPSSDAGGCPMIGTALLLVSAILIGAIYPAIVERFTAEPERARRSRRRTSSGTSTRLVPPTASPT